MTHFAKSCEFSIGRLYASPAQRGRGVVPPPWTNILLHQNRGSKHNKDCTCEFQSWGDLKQANPACPVQGHRYALFLHVLLWSSTPSLYASPSGGEA